MHFYTNQIHATLWSFTCAAVKLSLFQENNLSNSILRRVKCRTEAVNHLSRSLETWKNAKYHFIEAKIDKLTESSDITSNMKSTLRKTWQTSLLFLEPLQKQNLKRKNGGTWHIISPHLAKWVGHVPRVPHQVAPMTACMGMHKHLCMTINGKNVTRWWWWWNQKMKDAICAKTFFLAWRLPKGAQLPHSWNPECRSTTPIGEIPVMMVHPRDQTFPSKDSERRLVG